MDTKISLLNSYDVTAAQLFLRNAAAALSTGILVLPLQTPDLAQYGNVAGGGQIHGTAW